MDTFRIAVIPGDGIGAEVVDQGIRVLEAAGKRFGFAFEWTRYPWSCAYYRETGRLMPGDGLEQLRRFDAIYLGAVGGSGRARPCLPLGAAAVHPPGFPAVHEPAPGARLRGGGLPAGGPPSRGDRLHRGAREQRGGVLAAGRAPFPRYRRRGGAAAERLHPPRGGPHPAPRLRAGPVQAEEAPHLGHQIQRHPAHHALLGRALPGHRRGVPGRAGRSVPRRHPLGPGPGPGRQHRPGRRGGTSTRSGSTRPCSRRCTARAP